MLVLENVRKTYRNAEVETTALDGISFEVQQGEFVAIMGPSGCGKSTLLNVLGLLDAPSSGTYRFLGDDMSRCSEAELAARRRDCIGFIFQSFNLIEDLTVAENVEVALLYRKTPRTERRRRVEEMLERVGLAHRARYRPQQLSGGQQQRIALARALVGRPSLILADEPTGNLDSANGSEVMALLGDAADDGATVLMVTHSQGHAAAARRTLKLLDGRIVSQTHLQA